jgi:hypothetical protein
VEGVAGEAPDWHGDLPAPERVIAHIRLVSGRSIFREGLATGTFELVGEELHPQTCGACVFLRYQSDPDDLDSPFEHFFVTHGTLDITDLGLDRSGVPHKMVGSLSNAGFVHILEPDDPTPAADGCETSIERLEFDVVIIYTD